MIKTYIYIDGFNLYYGGLKKSPHKWLDLKNVIQKTLSDQNNIISIKYFTAKVSGQEDVRAPLRQQQYFKALKKYIPEISIHLGKFMSHPVLAPLANPTPEQILNEETMVEIVKTEEKGSDVNLAVHLLNDAWLDKYDCGVIISNDSDLATSIDLVKNNHDKKIGVLFPPNFKKQSVELKKRADFVRTIRTPHLASSQLPNPIPGTILYKPIEWEIEAELYKKGFNFKKLKPISIGKIIDNKQEISFSFLSEQAVFFMNIVLKNHKIITKKISKEPYRKQD